MLNRCAVLGALLLASTLSARQDVGSLELSDVHVRGAIRAMVDELYARKDPRTFWEPGMAPAGESQQDGGYTALTVLALLSAGESYQDPRLRDAIEYLEKLEMDGTYAVCLRASVWASLPPRFAPALERDVRWLTGGFSERAGGWNYRQEPRTSRRDNSITQYGALALWEAAKRGVRVEPRLWSMLEDRFLEMQLADGGWNYLGDGPASGSMTAAGLATIFITQDVLHADDDVRGGTGRQPYEDALERGLLWMSQNFSPTDNAGTFRDYYYYLYGVERVGLASGMKRFGTHDWFREGAAELIRRLCVWDAETQTMTVHERIGGSQRAGEVRVRHLAFALMFLSRGRVPVCVNKLAIDGHAWNDRPRDAANLSRWITDSTETKLSWQIVRAGTRAEDWLDAPILYLTSRDPLPWLDRFDVDAHVQAARENEVRRRDGDLEAAPPPLPDGDVSRELKRYIDLGGMLLAAAETDDRGFAGSIESLGLVLYPHLEWRELPPDHWAYTIVHPVDQRTPLRGLSNGVRELMVLARSGGWPRVFQSRDERRDDDFQTAANLYLYASEKNQSRARIDRHTLGEAVAPSGPPTIVRAIYDGNWCPEPMALEMLRRSAPELADIVVADRPLDAIHEITPAPSLVVVTGVEAHEFTPEERAAVNAYVTDGGVLLFETVGGRGGFGLSAERMAAEELSKPIRSMLRSPALANGSADGTARAMRVEYRPFSFQLFGGRETTPRLRGMRIDGVDRVLFSREDLSHALLGQPCWGISGYTTASARQVMQRIVDHARTTAPNR